MAKDANGRVRSCSYRWNLSHGDRGSDKCVHLTGKQGDRGAKSKKLSTKSRALEPAKRDGSDEFRSLAYIKLVVIFLPKHLAQTYLNALSID